MGEDEVHGQVLKAGGYRGQGWALCLLKLSAGNADPGKADIVSDFVNP